jgi:hypothetical protein
MEAQRLRSIYLPQIPSIVSHQGNYKDFDTYISPQRVAKPLQVALV